MISADEDLAFAGPAAIAELVRAREVHPRELVELSLRRIETLNPQLRAFRTTMPDEALAAAERTAESDGPLAGVPVAVLGLVFFAVMLVLQLPAMWRRTDHRVRQGRMAWSLVGVATVIYLLSVELFAVDAICLWCTSVHVLTLIVFGTTTYATVTYPPPALDSPGAAEPAPS